MTEVSYFNKAVIWGTPGDINERSTKDHKRPYLDMRIACPSDKYGDICVYARMWGDEAIAAFLKAHIENPEGLYKFNGVLSQFDREGAKLTGFHLFKWAYSEEKLKRAVFILRGVCTGRDVQEDTISVNWKQKGDHAVDTTFRLYGGAALMLPGDIVDIKGALKDKDVYFGGSGLLIPYVEEVDVKGEIAREAGKPIPRTL